MKIKFCGAATGVTGSCHLLEGEGHKILLDCGQFQGGKTQEKLNAEPFPFDIDELEESPEGYRATPSASSPSSR